MSKSLREQLAERRTALEAGEEVPEVELNAEEEAALEEPEEEVVEEQPAEEVVEEPAAEEPAVAAEAASAEGEPAAEAFTPEFKYRADGKDMEIPEYLRSIIKDKDSQEKVVKMLEKYEAFDTVSSRRDQFRTERDEARTLSGKYQNALTGLKSTIDREDIDGALKLLEIPEEKMLEWATKKAKYYMGDEAYRRQIDQETQMRQKNWSTEAQANDYQTKYQEMEVRQLQTEFNYEMLKPEVSSFSTAFDKFAGKQGAFIEEVRNRGELAYLREQKTIAPSEVIQGIMKQFSTISSAPNPAPAAASNKPATKVVVKTASKVPTIPTVRGTQASPTKEGFTSMDKLRQYRKDTYGK